MKVNMWMIRQRLLDFGPEVDISCNEVRIRHFKVNPPPEEEVHDPEILYIWSEKTGMLGHKRLYTFHLQNGDDTLTLSDVTDTAPIVAMLYEAYRYVNEWEKSFREALEQKSLFRIVNLIADYLQNPVLLADMHGEILAASHDAPLPGTCPSWEKCIEENRMPLYIVGNPHPAEEGPGIDDPDFPNLYLLDDGTRVIGRYLGFHNLSIGGISIWNTSRYFLPSDPYLLNAICEDVIAYIKEDNLEISEHTPAGILSDMLKEKKTDDLIISFIKNRYPGPWRIAVLRTVLTAANQIRSVNGYLATCFNESSLRCVPFEAGQDLVILVNEQDVGKLVRDPLLTGLMPRIRICLSQPFDDIYMIRQYYLQAVNLYSLSDGAPSVCFAEDYGLRYILNTLRGQSFKMTHPALETLKQHDQEKGSELYVTLRTYLQNERSTLKTASALHIHKNTLLYRIRQIEEMLDLDLGSYEVRLYLQLSFAMD